MHFLLDYMLFYISQTQYIKSVEVYINSCNIGLSINITVLIDIFFFICILIIIPSNTHQHHKNKYFKFSSL